MSTNILNKLKKQKNRNKETKKTLENQIHKTNFSEEEGRADSNELGGVLKGLLSGPQ